MASATVKFDFIAAYRQLMPAETREIIDARKAAFTVLRGQSSKVDRIRDLCRLSFKLGAPNPTTLAWFETAMKASDEQFTMEVDVVEAGRIASLILTEKIIKGDTSVALFVLTTAVGGIRVAVDPGLPLIASDAIASSAARPSSAHANKLDYPHHDQSKSMVEAVKQTFDGNTVNQALGAVVTEARENAEEFSERVSAALTAERNARDRIGEEVNMLWWYIGEGGRLVDKPRKDFPDLALAMIVGADLASFVREVPGPYGAAAILNRSLGSAANQSIRLTDAVDALSESDLAAILVEPPQDGGDLFPIHFAMKSAHDNGIAQWQTVFERVTGLKSKLKMTRYQLALQVYRERVLLNAERAE